MIAAPKPLAADRKLAEYERKIALKRHRHVQYGIAEIRAINGLCEICNKRLGRDCHHVYGRGRDEHDWREQANVMLIVCRECHPPPIKHKPAGPKLAWVEDILERINK